MPKLTWDQVGERRFETGLDRGVLYLDDGTGVPWNGLTSVVTSADNIKVTPYYVDGVRYYNDRSAGEFSATIKAFTYPDEFMQFDGILSPALGMYLDDQDVDSRFGLSYRTRIGNDVKGSDFAYKIHILYNLSAVPTDKTYTSQGKDVDPSEFSWDVTGIPEPFSGYRPTVHAIVDSRTMTSSGLALIEDKLYGSSTTSATLPSLQSLFGLVFAVLDNGDGTWTATGDDTVIQYIDSTTFQINWPTAQMIDTDSYTIA
jgi:hypothetical protein